MPAISGGCPAMTGGIRLILPNAFPRGRPQDLGNPAHGDLVMADKALILRAWLRQ
ncbi:hypothetical protein [Microbispora sp. NBRC 16548]|uniref:hypothetical protein n=1 Tax=Microbispora sp. NBRC 16548 TaxID=3030994 RepID=UPI0016116CE4|nr:hypothetical protein [Microbispora sp. NBRC 16548]